MPRIQGGLPGLNANVRYTESARTAGVEGRVIVQFIVDTHGRVMNADVVRGIHADLDAEAMRVVRAAQFTPGRQRDRPVCVQMSLPITFQVGMDASAAPSAPSPVTAATESVENAVSSVSNQVEGTTASVSNAASSVTQGVESTKASVSSTTEEVSEAAGSLKETLGGLFGGKRTAETPEVADASGASDGQSEVAMLTFAAGEMVRAKIDLVPLLTRPANDAQVVTEVLASDRLVYMGEETGSFILVQTSKGQGWINKLLVVKP